MEEYPGYEFKSDLYKLGPEPAQPPFNEKVELMFCKLKNEDTLTSDQAISIATEIANEIDILIGKEKSDQKKDEKMRSENLIKLYKRAAEAYLLAAKKVPYSNVEILKPASFWKSLAEAESWARARI